LEVRLDAAAAVLLDGLSYRRAGRMVGISKTEVDDSLDLLLARWPRWGPASPTAAQHRTDDVQLLELDGVGRARPLPRQLPRADHQAALGEHALQLASLPDAAVGGPLPEVGELLTA
jgi:hypothetical protein